MLDSQKSAWSTGTLGWIESGKKAGNRLFRIGGGRIQRQIGVYLGILVARVTSYMSSARVLYGCLWLNWNKNMNLEVLGKSNRTYWFFFCFPPIFYWEKVEKRNSTKGSRRENISPLSFPTNFYRPLKSVFRYVLYIVLWDNRKTSVI